MSLVSLVAGEWGDPKKVGQALEPTLQQLIQKAEDPALAELHASVLLALAQLHQDVMTLSQQWQNKAEELSKSWQEKVQAIADQYHPNPITFGKG